MSIFKAYDVRGIYPSEINEDVVYKIGIAFVNFLKKKEETKKIIIGRDMRLSSNSLSKAFLKGSIGQGVDVVDLGLISTDCLYFASGKLNLAGIIFTASHNPKEYNGIKFVRKNAVAISSNTGLNEIEKLTYEEFEKEKKKGKIIKKDILKEYRKHVLSFINKDNLKKIKIVVDAGNGIAGKIIPLIYKDLPCKIIPLYFKLDGNFPNHLPNPIEKKNLIDIQKKIKEKKRNFGMAFDGDADRVFFLDENAKIIDASLINCLLIKHLLKNPGEKVIYNVACSKIVPETIKELGGIPVLERVGHSFIKETMRETKAIFGCEHSAHYYFRDNYRADSGIIAALIVTEIVSNNKLSDVLKPFEKYYKIEETNSKVEDKEHALRKLEMKYRDGKISKLDGITIEYSNWWFNVRPSNTEPLLRLNLEANSKELMEEKTKEVLMVIRS